MNYLLLLVGLIGLWFGTNLTIRGAISIATKLGMSVGNLIGSNIFDTLVPIGVASVIARLEFNTTMLRVDLPFLIALSGVVLVFLAAKKGLQKLEAAIVLALYFGYALVRLSIA